MLFFCLHLFTWTTLVFQLQTEIFLTTLDNWIDEITNFFLDRNSSAFVEGLNNKIKVLKRRCYCIFNLSHLFQRIFLDLVGYDFFSSSY
ncbi:MAG: transposase [Acidobacteria bacterium]|nr:transposase [Acidobacteriota bacterium]